MDAILTSDVIGTFKPNPSVYQTALRALQASPNEIAMVAAHAYDLEAAKKEWVQLVICSELERVGWCAAYEFNDWLALWSCADLLRYRGYKTIYIMRHTEDVGLDPERLKAFDLVIREGGLGELARRLGAATM